MRGLLLIALSMSACAEDASSAGSTPVVVIAPPGSAIDLTKLEASAPQRVLAAEASGGAARITVKHASSGPLTLRFAGACDVEVTATRQSPIRLTPLLSVSPDQPQIGFDTAFELVASPGCEQARQGRIRWRQVGGLPLVQPRVLDDGARFAARTVPIGAVMPAGFVDGLLPISPDKRASAVVEVSWTPADGGPVVLRTVRVAATARSRGLPSIPVDVAQLIGGDGWRVERRPEGSSAQVVAQSGWGALRPDRPGDWTLTREDGRRLELRAGSYDDTPLDCGRSGCHAQLVEHAARSPMATALRDGLQDRSRRAGDYPSCAQGCHSVGEPGARDGGFSHVAQQLGVRAEMLDSTSWALLPRPLRRLGGVGCLACHGPGAVPVKADRWSILRSDVCAYCHDAPPSYRVVQDWQRSAMAKADRDPRTREAPCARCHTTWGFLAGQGLGVAASRRPPAGAPGIGVACAACHAVHGDSGERLLRSVKTPAPLDGLAGPALARSSSCIACHADQGTDSVPSASSAAIWAGRGGLDPATGAALVGAPPTTPCVACHVGHSFVATPAQLPAAAALQRSAESLFTALAERGVVPGPLPGAGAAPAHAGDWQIDTTTRLGRSARNVLLVLEDRGAAAHNPLYARQLLDSVAQALAP